MKLSDTFETNRFWISLVSTAALIGCCFGSWLSFGVLCVATVEYLGIAALELWHQRIVTKE